MKLYYTVISIFIFMCLITLPVQAKLIRKQDSFYYSEVISPENVIVAIKEYQKKPYKTLVLNSPGGSFEAGMILATFVNEYDINVSVPEYCGSACTFAFFAAHNKTMGDNAKLAMHNVSLTTVGLGDTISVKDAIAASATVVKYSAAMMLLYTDAGLPRDVLFKIGQSVDKEAVILNKTQLQKYGIIP